VAYKPSPCGAVLCVVQICLWSLHRTHLDTRVQLTTTPVPATPVRASLTPLAFASHTGRFTLLFDARPSGSVGAARNAQALADCGVAYVVNASPLVPCFHKDRLRYRLVHAFDDAACDLAQHFEATNRFIRKARLARDPSEHHL
jgi:hypothetical protein